jgi:SAM-dependent methyltransferase
MVRAVTRKSEEEYRTLSKRVAAQLRPGASVLEVAPGPGYFCVELAKLGDYRITGIDISRTFVEIARAASWSSVRFLVLRRDASWNEIKRAVEGMKLGWLNAVITRLIFRFLLLKRAYVREEVEQFVSQTKFRTAEIREELIGLEAHLKK